MTARSMVRVAFVIFVVLIVQSTIMLSLRVGGAHPDLLWLLPITAALLDGPETGAIVGFWAGLAFDLVLPTPFGLSALVGCLLGGLRGPLSDLRGLLPDPVHESHRDSPFSPSYLPQQHHSPIPLPRPATQPGRRRIQAVHPDPPHGPLRRGVVPEISSLPWSRRQLHWQRRGMSASGAALSRLAGEEAAP